MPHHGAQGEPGEVMRALIVPSESIDGCDFCVAGGGAFRSDCRACVVRWCSRLPRTHRTAVYQAAQDQHGEEGMRAFMEEVRAFWAKEREALRRMRLAQHEQGMAAVRKVIS